MNGISALLERLQRGPSPFHHVRTQELCELEEGSQLTMPAP